MSTLKRVKGLICICVILVIMMACAGPEPTPTSTPTLIPTATPLLETPESTEQALDLQLIIASTDLSIGSNRVVFAIIDFSGNTVKTPSVDVSTFFLADTGDGTAVETTTARFRPWPVGGGVYTTDLSFHKAGTWGIGAVITDAGGIKRLGKATIQVKELSVTPAIGAVAPRSNSKITNDVDALEELTSDPSPDPELYTMTIAQAIVADTPVVVSFSTPAFCQTFTCGPQLDVVKKLKERYKGQVNFIHIEVYDNPHEIQGDLRRARIAPTVLEWQLLSEPWTFVLDSKGLVFAKFEGFTTEEELELSLIRLLKSAQGLVTDVRSSSLLQVDSFTFPILGGLSLEFIVDEASDFGEFTPSHLRQHGVLNEPVTVFFRETPKGLVAERITD